MSFKVEIKVFNESKFTANGVRLATREEAEKYGSSKAASWTMVDEYRVVESEEPVNYKWNPSDPSAFQGLVKVEGES